MRSSVHKPELLIVQTYQQSGPNIHVCIQEKRKVCFVTDKRSLTLVF